jgi:hypothetical protein
LPASRESSHPFILPRWEFGLPYSKVLENSRHPFSEAANPLGAKTLKIFKIGPFSSGTVVAKKARREVPSMIEETPPG